MTNEKCRDRTQHATHPEMVQIWQENTLQSDEPSRKMIGNSNHSSGKTRLSKRTLVTLDTNNLQRSHKKKKSKKKVSKVSISFSSLDNTHEASNIFNNDHEENIAPSTSSRLTPLSASGATTSHVVTTVSTLHEELDEENKSSSPVDRLNQLRYTLRGGRTPVSSPPLVQQAHSTLIWQTSQSENFIVICVLHLYQTPENFIVLLLGVTFRVIVCP